MRVRALALLGRREYSRRELGAALQRKGFEPGAVAEALSELAGEGLLDDSRYAGSLVRQFAARGKGPARVRQSLNEAGVASDAVAAALDSGPDWLSAAAEARRRKFGAEIPCTWPERARQMRFLQYRGFSADQIAAALGPARETEAEQA